MAIQSTFFRLMKATFLIISFLSQIVIGTPIASAQECILRSEFNETISIVLSKRKDDWRIFTGVLKRQGKPLYAIESTVGMGHGGQYYHFGKLNTQSKRIGKEEMIVSGMVHGFVGNQIGRGTPRHARKYSEQIRVLFSDLARGYYYSLGEERFKPTTETTEVLNSLEGIFIGGRNCAREYFVYTW